MKNGKANGYKTFKKALIAIGVAAAFALLLAILFMLIPFMKELHGL
ncbi:MAG: hypothetical protein FWF86_04595 [Clostridia bacterium]|nr:hypothetical protein [Clostridia bacterium]